MMMGCWSEEPKSLRILASAWWSRDDRGMGGKENYIYSSLAQRTHIASEDMMCHLIVIELEAAKEVKRVSIIIAPL